MNRSDIPTFAFDHHSADFKDRRLEIYEELRGLSPVVHSPTHDGFDVIARYADVGEIARDPERFSSAAESLLIPSNRARKLLPIQVDPPELDRFRALISPFLTPRAIRLHEDAIQVDIDEALAGIVERGSAELVGEFCELIPTRATMRLIGFDPANWEVFAKPLHDAAFSIPGSPEQLEAIRLIHQFDSIIEKEIDTRYDYPCGDLISELIKSEFEGITTSREEVVNLVRMLIFGGMDTVGAAMSNVVAMLAERDDLRQFLVADLERIPRAIEEFLRYEPPIQGFARYVMEDTNVSGCPVTQGERVFILWGSANHDETEFADPGTINLERFPNRHFTFGIGAHRCMGSTMARTEMRMMLESFLKAMPDFYVSEAGILEPNTIGQILSKREVNVTVGKDPQLA
ncbi:MAG: cytochrome P450 [Actinomycetes bacterium]